MTGLAESAPGTAIAAALALLVLFAPTTNAREIHSYALVNDDATLKVSGRHIRLYGIHIPRVGDECASTRRTSRCSQRAAHALESKIQGFVRCRPLRKHKDRSVTAQCFNRDEDLGAYLLERGLAVARSSAPLEYQTLERIAERRGVGIWNAGVHTHRRHY